MTTGRVLFWNTSIMSCSPLKVNRCFGETYRLYLLGRRVKNQSTALKIEVVSSPLTSTSARIYSVTSHDTVLIIKTHPSFDRAKCFLLLIERSYLGTLPLCATWRHYVLFHILTSEVFCISYSTYQTCVILLPSV
jgi:hypothetical protein